MPYLLSYYLCIIEIQLVCEESLKRKYKSSIKCSVKKSDKWSAYNHNQRSSGSWATAETWKRSLKFQRGGWDFLYHWFFLLRQQDQSSSRKTPLPGSCEFPGKRRGIIKKKKCRIKFSICLWKWRGRQISSMVQISQTKE